jgi:2,3-bisphosphoglycerate-independent phosphoglycerate mutase
LKKLTGLSNFFSKILNFIVRKKIVFLVVDGLADLPINGKTPLKEAKKPNLDWFAKNGITGEMLLIKKSLWKKLISASISHVANISLLGYSPEKYKLKRGTLEAIGADLPYKEGELAVRCNFATVDKDLRVIDRRAGRNFFGLNEIVQYINENVDISVPFLLKRTYGHRAVLWIKKKLSDEITTNDPFVTGEKVKKIQALKKEAQITAKIVQDFVDKVHSLIEYHPANVKRIKRKIPPANFILVREAGNSLLALPNFCRKYKVKAVCIAENGAMKATCMLAGFDAITVPEFELNGKIDMKKTLDFIFNAIENSLPEYDFIYAHIKSADEASHDGDFKRKVKAIEAIDKKLKNFRNFDGILVVTCDHITSTEQKKHAFGPVPVLVYGLGKDKVKNFDEFSVKKGKLGLIDGKKLMKYIFAI